MLAPIRARGAARASRLSAGAALAFASLLLLMRAAGAAGQTGAISGTLRLPTGAPLPHVTIYVVPRDSAASYRATLTDSAGSFAFADLAAGEYFLRADRVGYESEWTDARRVADGQHLRLELTSEAAPLHLSPIKARGVCLQVAELAQDSALATLWREARKAATARRLFDLSYRYRVDTAEMLTFTRSFSRRTAHHRVASTPEVARALAQKGSYAGFGVGMDSTRLVSVPEMLEVLTDEFARTHCLSLLPDRFDEHSVRFEPLAVPEANATEIAGNVVLGANFVLKRIEFEYRRGAGSFSRGYVEFGEGPKKSPIRFAKFVMVSIFNAPVTTTEHLELDPRAYTGWDRNSYERATVDVHYGAFVRDTTAP